MLGLPSQSAKPGGHDGLTEVQLEALQVPEEQVVLQAPQLAESLTVLVSHPLSGFESQFAKPGLHTQAELEQLCEAEHVELQAPQLAPSIRKSVSHPLAEFPSQFSKPAWQVNPQLPAPEHVASLLGRFGQTWPVLPQLPTVLIWSSSEQFF